MISAGIAQRRTTIEEPVPPGTGAGSYAPITLAGGKTLVQLTNIYPCALPSYTALSVEGFTSDPGANWLVFFRCEDGGGTTLLASDAAYVWFPQYNRGSWWWLNAIRQWGAHPTICTIVHE